MDYGNTLFLFAGTLMVSSDLNRNAIVVLTIRSFYSDAWNTVAYNLFQIYVYCWGFIYLEPIRNHIRGGGIDFEDLKETEAPFHSLCFPS